MRFCFDQKDFVEKDIDPHKLAVIGDDFELTWNEFATRVDALCDQFQSEQWVRPTAPVIIYGHKSANMLVAMYAMMKLEIAYIPLDQVYPMERIHKIRAISGSQIVLNTTDEAIHLESTCEGMIAEKGIHWNKTVAPAVNATKSADPLVYVIFTSGSTGEPKGVQITTEAVRSFTKWMTSDFGFQASDVFVNTAILSFDLSVFEVMTFGALGATLLLNNKTQTADPNILIPRIEQYKGTIWVSTPSFSLVYSRIKNETRLDSLRYFLFCGEILPHDLTQRLVDQFPKAKVYNTYGPTEATVATTLIEINQTILDQYNPLPVGKSKRDSQLIIDNGEIVIVGPNVSIGYVNNEELNAEKFIEIDGQRAFKTGDHGFIKDEMLFFNGRNDDLVKLHGYRIELNEISSAINKLDYVLHGETIALMRNGAVKKIVSLVKLQQEDGIDANKIKDDLATVLPHYMIPSDIKFLDEIPLNQNGKADKKRLTEIYLQR